MGNSPTGTTDSTENDTEEEETEIHPDQTTVPEHDTPEADDSDEETSPTPLDEEDGGSAGSGGGSGAAPVTPSDKETEPEIPEDDTDDNSKEVTYDMGDSEESEETEDAENKDEEPELNEAEITVYTDSWDVTGWNNEPDLRRLQETFGDKLTVSYDFLPARTIEEWEADNKMPAVEDPNLPESTTDSYRALIAAREQGHARKYLQRLQIAALSEGRNIESEDVLVALADEVGLDTDQLREDMGNIELKDPEPIEETPQMEVMITDVPHYWTENIEFGRVFGRMVGEGIQPESAGGSMEEFVTKYEWVATTEVTETFELDRDQVIEKLSKQRNIVSQDFGVGTFWTTS